jgi:phosphoglycerate kinase
MKTLTDFDFKIKKIIRVDFNVPLDENLNVTDATRIEAGKTYNRCYLSSRRGSVILMSHLGRPKEKKILIEAYFEDNFSSSGSSGEFVSDCIGQEAENAAALGECC